MFTLKHVVVLVILQNTVSSQNCIYFEGGETNNMCGDETLAHTTDEPEYSSEHSGNKLYPLCPEEGHSLISYSDIKYLIEEKAAILKIKENFLNSYYPEWQEIFKKYMDELDGFLKQFKDRPEHMLHILDDMTSLRQKLEPDVEEIAAKIEEFHSLENNYKAVAEVSVNLLTQLDKYKTICEISCEDYAIENRFALESNPLIVSKLPGMYCVTLKDLNDNISEKLNAVRAHYEEDSNHHIEIGEKQISEFKNNLKEAAVKQFGMTMYDVLSLQDDYHHFAKHLSQFNISIEIYDILENTAEIELRLIGMKRNLEKFRKYCMKCNTNRRIKRNVFDPVDDSIYDNLADFNIPTETTIAVEMNIVEELINATINEITETIKMNSTAMFKELDKIINDPNVIDVYIKQLHSMQNEIGNNIKMEQEAFNRLSNSISGAPIDKIRALSQESKQMIQTLEFAKQFIDSFISRNSK